ncbi:hypothetical protein EON80_15640 [bacterium]|nr:MAG: hypothetical protein EON80_15640 [bacterium]
MKPFIFAASLLLTATCAHAQQTKPLAVINVPLLADAPVLFAPRGWKVEKTINGDLNRDKVPDAALVLVENKAAKDKNGYATERRRALVVLLRTGKGWTRVGFNNSLLLGTSDGGAFFGVMETPVDISILKGVLLIDQENGSREVTQTTHKFRYDAAQKRVFLIGAENVDRDRATGNVTTVSINYLTGVQIKRTFNIEKDGSKVNRSRVSRKLRPLEWIKVDERYSG